METVDKCPLLLEWILTGNGLWDVPRVFSYNVWFSLKAHERPKFCSSRLSSCSFTQRWMVRAVILPVVPITVPWFPGNRLRHLLLPAQKLLLHPLHQWLLILTLDIGSQRESAVLPAFQTHLNVFKWGYTFLLVYKIKTFSPSYREMSFRSKNNNLTTKI